MVAGDCEQGHKMARDTDLGRKWGEEGRRLNELVKNVSTVAARNHISEDSIRRCPRSTPLEIRDRLYHATQSFHPGCVREQQHPIPALDPPRTGVRSSSFQHISIRVASLRPTNECNRDFSGTRPLLHRIPRTGLSLLQNRFGVIYDASLSLLTSSVYIPTANHSVRTPS